MILHGGRLNAARAAYPDAPEPWIDLSTGINPHAYPLPDLTPDVWTRLPEPEAEAALRAAAARAYGTVPDCVVAAPGSSALIAALPRLLPGPAAILGPTYGEYAAAWPDAVTVSTPAALAGYTVRVVCQPNNPDGAMLDPAALMAVARGGTLVLDQAFADFGGAADAPEAIRLRSFGKAYGLAGVRLGFALAEPAMADRLRRALGPWPVSGAAIRIGCRALDDSAWRAAMAARLRTEAARLDALAVAAGMTVLGGTALFRLLACDAEAWFGRLAQAGILVRRFPGRNWLRLGLAPDWAWPRLAEALSTRT